MSPAAPDAASVCPMLSLTEPIKSSSVRSAPPKVRRMLSHSMGSPTSVPTDRIC